ncbi:MAG: DegT/DnrJ/EryC1/StrS family aminotransferase, partial [Spirochaetales bacterium]|nr:DegT/DnrJ/EryC1/StrS family aminotransferase [Spirochaetales bacterium]
MINVTKTYLPDFEEYSAYLRKIWETGHITNHGPLVTELEERITEFMGAEFLSLVNNGTIALQIAVKALDLQGEIIVTPFSYVASVSSIVWSGCTPVFVDIDPNSLTIDPAQIENAITPETSAILATHVFAK